MFVQDATPMLDALTIHYLVPHPPSALDDASPFQLISPGVLDTATAFDVIARLPRDASELVLDADELVAARIAGRGYSVVPLMTTVLWDALQRLSGAIVVVLSATDAVAATVADIISGLQTPVLHAALAQQRLTKAAIRDHCLSMADFWKTHRPGLAPLAEILSKELKDWQDPIVPTELDFQGFTHLLTAPNIATLATAGYHPHPPDELLLGHDNGPYYDALKASVDAICSIRNAAISRNQLLAARSHTDVILTVPGVLKVWRHVRRGTTLSADATENRLLRSLLRQLIGRDTYCQTMEAETLKRLKSSPIAQGILQLNLRDIEAYSAALCVRGASSFAPVIRLPLSPNLAYQDLAQLASAVRNQRGASPHKLNRLAKAVSTRLARGLPDWIFRQLRQSRRVKLISDAPLEWLDLDGFPLMLRADVSRIPITPGNLFLQLTLLGTEICLPCSMFKEVLVVRSFEPDDPIKPLLARAVEVYSTGLTGFPCVRIVDVGTRDELVEVLNSYEGAILVYDGHGTHSGESDVGHLA